MISTDTEWTGHAARLATALADWNILGARLELWITQESMLTHGL